MGDIREKAWVFPVVGGIIALIALLTPVAYLSESTGSFYVWMWGLFSIQIYGYGGATQFTQDPGEITISLISTLLVLISILAMIAIGSSKRYGVSQKSWVAPSVLLMIGTIIYIAGLEINTYNIGGYSFWNLVNPGFGVIGMFLGGIISLIGYGVLKMSPKPTRDVILPMKKEFMRSDVRYSAPIKLDTDLVSSSIKFCPNCGHKIVKADQKFCVNCGFQIENAQPEIVKEPEIRFWSVSSEIKQEPELKPVTIPPETGEGGEIKQDCENCDLSRKLGRQECIWCGKIL